MGLKSSSSSQLRLRCHLSLSRHIRCCRLPLPSLLPLPLAPLLSLYAEHHHFAAARSPSPAARAPPSFPSVGTLRHCCDGAVDIVADAAVLHEQPLLRTDPCSRCCCPPPFCSSLPLRSKTRRRPRWSLRSLLLNMAPPPRPCFCEILKVNLQIKRERGAAI